MSEFVDWECRCFDASPTIATLSQTFALKTSGDQFVHVFLVSLCILLFFLSYNLLRLSR